jgi:hypothetical protein
MAKTTAYYEGYLDQEARLDAAAPVPERKTKSRRRADAGAIKCGPGNKACGKRCIPEAQKCRKEGVGSVAAKVGGAIAFGAAAAATGSAATGTANNAERQRAAAAAAQIPLPKAKLTAGGQAINFATGAAIGTAAVGASRVIGHGINKGVNAVQENNRKRKAAKAYKPENLGGKGVSSEDTVRAAYKEMGIPKALPAGNKGGAITVTKGRTGLPPGHKGGDIEKSTIETSGMSRKEKVAGAALNTAKTLAKSGQKLVQKVAEKTVKAGKRTIAAGAEARKTVSGMRTPKLNDF